MSVKIRLARYGAKKRPFYRIVAANSTSARNGKFLEILGTYNPLLADTEEKRVVMNSERITYWLSVGAIPSERVAKFIEKAGISTKKAS